MRTHALVIAIAFAFAPVGCSDSKSSTDDTKKAAKTSDTTETSKPKAPAAAKNDESAAKKKLAPNVRGFMGASDDDDDGEQAGYYDDLGDEEGYDEPGYYDDGQENLGDDDRGDVNEGATKTKQPSGGRAIDLAHELHEMAERAKHSKSCDDVQGMRDVAADLERAAPPNGLSKSKWRSGTATMANKVGGMEDECVNVKKLQMDVLKWILYQLEVLMNRSEDPDRSIWW